MKEQPHTMELEFIGEPVLVSVQTSWDADGKGIAVQLVCEEEVRTYTTVSVSVAGVQLADDEFVFKTDSENAGLLEVMVAEGFVELTGRATEFGPICRLLDRPGESGEGLA